MFLLPDQLTLIRWAVMAVLGSALFAFGWLKGDEHGTQRFVDYTERQVRETIRVTQARSDALVRVETRWRTKIETIVKKGDVIIKEVPVYVTKSDDSRCVVPVGFVRVYDAAVANDPDPGAASESDRADSGVPLSAVAETDAFNLKVGHLWRARATQCIEAYEAVRTAK